MNRDDRIHGALLILNELVRISSMEGEVRNHVRKESGFPSVNETRRDPCPYGGRFIRETGSKQVNEVISGSPSPVK